METWSYFVLFKVEFHSKKKRSFNTRLLLFQTALVKWWRYHPAQWRSRYEQLLCKPFSGWRLYVRHWNKTTSKVGISKRKGQCFKRVLPVSTKNLWTLHNRSERDKWYLWTWTYLNVTYWTIFVSTYKLRTIKEKYN